MKTILCLLSAVLLLSCSKEKAAAPDPYDVFTAKFPNAEEYNEDELSINLSPFPDKIPKKFTCSVTTGSFDLYREGESEILEIKMQNEDKVALMVLDDDLVKYIQFQPFGSIFYLHFSVTGVSVDPLRKGRYIDGVLFNVEASQYPY